MGWTWTCFGGRKERLRRLDSDGRVRHKTRERPDHDTQTSTTSKPPSLAAQTRSKSPATDPSAYDQPFQPKQVVCGSLQGSKLFRRKTVRRANSLGSTSFENGAKKNCDKKSAAKTSSETQSEVLVDRLQEEVEALRKRLAEEEAEARKLRNEVVYLRSCGVLQSPERISCSSLERDSPSPGSIKDDRAQRQWQSWLGLTLSPTSRIKLEDQLRLMAAEEMSKNGGKGLTNGQKALIVASRLWHYQADDALHASQVKFEHRDSYSSDTSSCFGNNVAQNQSLDNLLPEKDVLPEGSRSRQMSKEAPLPECEEESTLHVASFRDSLDLKFPPGSNIVQEINAKTSPSSYESENFSFHPSSEKPVIKDVTEIQRATSSPRAARSSAYHTEELDGEFDMCPAEEQVKFESPRRSYSLPNPGAPVPISDEARRLIDLRYQELEDKLSKSPERLSLSSSPIATPDRSPPHPLSDTLQVEALDSAQQDSLDDSPPDVKRFPLNKTPPDSEDALSDEDSPGSPSTPVISKPFFSGRTGRIWQPLSPVKEVDSGLSSVAPSEKDTGSVFSSQNCPESAEGGLSTDSWTSETKFSSRSSLSVSERDGHDEASSTTDSTDGADDVHDDDLFTLSPRRLNSNYDPWDDDQNFQAGGMNDAKVDTSADSSTTTDWNSSDDSDFDILPIQCQSPDMSPKPLRSKFAMDNNDLKLKEYPRDKYLKEMGLKVDELLASSESVLSTVSLGAQKENQKSSESVPLPGSAHPAAPAGPPLTKSTSANELTVSHDSAHPVLASIENLPKWIEYQGIHVGPLTNKESMQIASQVVNRDEIVQAQRDVMLGENDACEQSNSLFTRPASRAELQRNERSNLEEPELDTYQVQVEISSSSEAQPFYFEICQTQDRESSIRDIDENPHRYQVGNDKHHRYSPVSERQSEKCEGERKPAVQVILAPTRQNEAECCSIEAEGIDVGSLQLDAYSSTEQPQEVVRGPGFGDKDYSSSIQAGGSAADRAEDFAESFDSRNTDALVISHGGLAVHTRAAKTNHLEAGERGDQNVDRSSPTNICRTPRLSVSDSSVEETESPRESCSSNQVVQSPGVSNDSEVVTSFSRENEGTPYSYESSLLSAPTLIQRHRETSFGTSDPAVEDEANNSDSGGSERDLYPVYPARGQTSISPDDRPILGTVATWWGDESLSKSRRWWDGQGIPNSTSKYKEDQRVNWHTTPFETRLEQALATQTTVPTEPSDQRNLFEGGVEPVIESTDSKDPDVLKPAAQSVAVI